MAGGCRLSDGVAGPTALVDGVGAMRGRLLRGLGTRLASIDRYLGGTYTAALGRGILPGWRRQLTILIRMTTERSLLEAVMALARNSVRD